MSEEVKLIQSIDDRDMVKALKQQMALMEKFEKKLDTVGKEGQKSGDAMSKSQRDAARIIEKNLTPLERYKQKLAQLKEHLDKDRISQQTFNREVARQKQIFQQNSEVFKAAKRKEREAHQLSIQQGKEGQKVWQETRTPLEQYAREVSKLRSLLKAGKIDQDTYNRALKVQNERLNTGEKNLRGMATGFIRSKLAAVGVTLATGQMLKNMIEARKEAEKTAIAMEKSLKKFQIQAGISDLESKESQTVIDKIATDTGVEDTTVKRISQEAMSQGFADPLRTGVTRTVIAAMQSAGQDPETANVEELVAGSAKYLQSAGKELTGKNLYDLMVRSRGLFKSTPIQLSDLPQFSKARGVAHQVGIKDKEFLSAGAILKQQQESPEASTGLGNFITKLASQDKNVKAALEKAGVKPESVDFAGEGLYDVSLTLSRAVDKLPEKDRVPFLTSLFGREKVNLQSAQALMAGAKRGDFQRFGQFQDDKEGFAEGVRVARSGVSAAVAKLEAETEMEKRKTTEQAVDAGEITEIEAEKFINKRRQRDRQNAKGFAHRASQEAIFLTQDAIRYFTGSDAFIWGDEEKEIKQKRESGFDTSTLEKEFQQQGQNAQEQNRKLDEANELQRENNELVREMLRQNQKAESYREVKLVGMQGGRIVHTGKTVKLPSQRLEREDEPRRP